MNNRFKLSESEKQRILTLHESAIKGQYLSEQSTTGTTNNTSGKTSNENIVTNHDRKYDYKKEGSNYFYKLKTTENWSKASGRPLEAIRVNVFKEKPSVSPQVQKEKDNLARAYRKWANSTDELSKKYGKNSKFDLDAESRTPYNSFFIKSFNAGKNEWNKSKKESSVDKKESSVAKNNSVGKMAYIKDKGGVNVRSQTKVNDGGINNILAPKTLYRMFKGDSTGKIGEIISSHKSMEYGDKKTWYRIKLVPMPEPYNTKVQKYGYVREDAIVIK